MNKIPLTIPALYLTDEVSKMSSNINVYIFFFFFVRGSKMTLLFGFTRHVFNVTIELSTFK